MQCILKGNIQSIALPDIITFINMINRNGELVFTKEGQRRTIFIEKGEIVFASSNDPDDSLGAFLVRSGLISYKDNEITSALISPGIRQGKILIEMGMIKPRELWWGVKNQVLDIIYRLFSWNQGIFEFYETEEAIKEKIALNISTTNIIMEGIRRLDEWAIIKSKIPSYSVVLEVSTNSEAQKKHNLSTEENDLLKLVNGKRSVRDIIRKSELGEFEVNKLLYAHLSSGIVSVKKKVDLSAIAVDDDTESLENTIMAYNVIFQYIFKKVKRKKPDNTIKLFNAYFEDKKTQESELYTGIKFLEDGMLDNRKLMSNIADIPTDKRNTVLDNGLNDLLSFQLFEMTRYLGKEEKEEIYSFVSKTQARV